MRNDECPNLPTSATASINIITSFFIKTDTMFFPLLNHGFKFIFNYTVFIHVRK